MLSFQQLVELAQVLLQVLYKFKISGSSISPADIIIVTEDGLIAGYNKMVNPNNAVVVVKTMNAVYKGIALGNEFIFCGKLSYRICRKIRC